MVLLCARSKLSHSYLQYICIYIMIVWNAFSITLYRRLRFLFFTIWPKGNKQILYYASDLSHFVTRMYTCTYYIFIGHRRVSKLSSYVRVACFFLFNVKNKEKTHDTPGHSYTLYYDRQPVSGVRQVMRAQVHFMLTVRSPEATAATTASDHAAVNEKPFWQICLLTIEKCIIYT